jgi:hypothetical protein
VKSPEDKDQIIKMLEQQVKHLDKTIARIGTENKRLKQSKAYQLAKKMDTSYRKVHTSLPVRAVRKAGRITKRAVKKPSSPATLDILAECYQYRPDDTSAKLQVGIICRAALVRPQSSAFIRLISPLSDPSLASKISISLFDGDTPASNYSKKKIDVFIVQRTAFSSLDKAKAFFAAAQKSGVPHVVDVDDAMSLLDKDHVEYTLQYPAIEAMEFLIKNAKQVYCSTELIRALYSKLNKQTFIVENSLDSRIWDKDKRQRQSPTYPLRIVYMGTVTHQSDFNMIVAALDRVYALHPDSFTLTVIGVSDTVPHRPYVQSEVLLPTESVYPRFATWFSNQPHYDIGLSPLEDTPFNRAKSDIKCLDYLALGIVPVVSNLSPYKDSDASEFSILCENTVEAWTTSLLRLVADKTKLQAARENAKQGKSYVWSKRSSAKTGELLLEHLKQIVT